MNKRDLVQEVARVGRNPKTGVTVSVPAQRIPFFRMGKDLRAILNPSPVPEAALP